MVKTARVHEKTVQRAESLAKSAAPPRKKRGKSKRPASSKVKVQTVDARVWSTALELAAGDASRIERRGDAEVIVWNAGSPHLR